MNIPKVEQETIITFNEAEKTASVYTMNKALIRKMEGLTKTRPGEARRVKTFPDGAQEYEVPKKWVKINASRILAPEEMKFRKELGRSIRLAQLSIKGGSADQSTDRTDV